MCFLINWKKEKIVGGNQSSCILLEFSSSVLIDCLRELQICIRQGIFELTIVVYLVGQCVGPL